MMANAIEQAHTLLDKLSAESFFGSITFQFKNGEVSLIRREETILPVTTETKTSNGRTGGGYERSKSW
jgi:hypothetical protein